MVFQRAFSVIPAEAGIQFLEKAVKYLDSDFHRSDDFSGKCRV
jgi:hypothetical protein